jgi:outer membrane protein TolC
MVPALALALASTPITAFAQAAEVTQPPQAEEIETISLTIDEAVQRGLQSNFRVQRTNRNEDIAEARVGVSRAQLRPRFDLGVGAGQNQTYFDFQGNAQTFNRAEPQFYADAFASASFPIDISGVVRRQVKQSRLSHDLSELDKAQATIDVASDIRVNYTTALRSQEQVRAEEEYLAQTDGLLQRARTSQPSVVSFLETERANALQTLESQKTSRDLALSTLRQLLRLPRGARLVLTTQLPQPAQVPSVDMLMDIATRNRIDLRQSQIRLEQARLATVQASDSRRPSLRITAYASQRLNDELPAFRDFDGRTRSAGIVIGANVPLFQYDGGVLRQNRRIAGIQADQALADREEATERAENEINQVMIGITRARQRLTSLPDVDQASAALARVEGLMLAAPASEAPGLVAQVTNARQNLRSAVVSRNDAMTDFYSNYFRLQKAVGSEELRSF